MVQSVQVTTPQVEPRPTVLPSEPLCTARTAGTESAVATLRIPLPSSERRAAAGSGQRLLDANGDASDGRGVLSLLFFPTRGSCPAPEEPQAPAAGRGGPAVRAEPGRPGPEPRPQPAVPACHQRADQPALCRPRLSRVWEDPPRLAGPGGSIGLPREHRPTPSSWALRTAGPRARHAGPHARPSVFTPGAAWPLCRGQH